MRFPLLLAGLILSFTLSAADKKPNILMIAIDDQNDWIRTPPHGGVRARGRVCVLLLISKAFIPLRGAGTRQCAS